MVHFAFRTDDEQVLRELAELGIAVGVPHYKGPPHMACLGSMVGLDAPESPGLVEWLKRRNVFSYCYTTFTKDEIARARWSTLQSDWHYGYPLPRVDEFGYLEATYDLTEYCPACGMGLRQKAPFQIVGEPKWRGRGLLSLNWVFDELFVKPEVWATIFQPYGVRSRPVLNRRGLELETIVQLAVEESVALDTTTLVPETCPRCRRVKYRGVSRGPLPPLVGEPSGHMARTAESFGAGGAAANYFPLVSQSLARALLAANVKGALLQPVASHIAQ